jgi:carboxylesterase type B
VTIFGQSSGSVSVFDHLLIHNGDNTYCGKPLFHGAIMASGSTLPALDVASPKAQAVYDTVVAAGGCAQASNTLDCLRALPFDKFNSAVNVLPSYESYRGIDLSYLPRPDPTDDFYPLSPEVANAKGHFARVPAIIGDMEDEGTYFAFPTSNVTTTEKLVDYVSCKAPQICCSLAVLMSP